MWVLGALTVVVLYLCATARPHPLRGWLHPISTATQRTAGEDCSSEDPPDGLGPSLAEQALRLKAVKLEKEVQDLTVSSRLYIICCLCLFSALNVQAKFCVCVFFQIDFPLKWLFNLFLHWAH